MAGTTGRDFTLSDLRERPGFAARVAERIWSAWWQHKGHPLEAVTDEVAMTLSAEPIPFGLVAHRGSRYLGSALAIACDLEERAQYSPWVAAVWVDAEERGKGIGRALVREAATRCFALGFPRAYLTALPERWSFYQALGWRRIEDGVGPDQLSVLVLDALGPGQSDQAPRRGISTL